MRRPYHLIVVLLSASLAWAGGKKLELERVWSAPKDVLPEDAGDGGSRASISANGARAATCSLESSSNRSGRGRALLRVWDAAKAKALATIVLPAEASSVALSSDGARALTGEEDRSIARLWDAAGGKELASIDLAVAQRPGSPRTLVAFLPGDGSALVASKETWAIWDLAKGTKTRSFKATSGSALAVSGDGKKAIAGGFGGDLDLVDVEKGAIAKNLARGDSIWAVALSTDGKRGVSGGNDGVVRLWDLEKGELVRATKPLGGTVWSVALSPDGKRALSAHSPPYERARVVTLWDLETGEALDAVDLAEHGAGYYALDAVAFFPDAKRALAAISMGGVYSFAVR